MSDNNDDLYSFNGPKVETPFSEEDGPFNPKIFSGPDPSVNYNDFQGMKKWELNYNGTSLVLPDNDKCPKNLKGRLLAFKSLTLSWSILPKTHFRTNDEVDYVWIENNQLWASSSAGFKYRIDHETGAILENHYHWHNMR